MIINKFIHNTITCTIIGSEITNQSGAGSVSATTRSLHIKTKECGLVVMGRTHVEGQSLESLSNSLKERVGDQVQIEVGAWSLRKDEKSGYRVDL